MVLSPRGRQGQPPTSQLPRPNRLHHLPLRVLEGLVIERGAFERSDFVDGVGVLLSGRPDHVENVAGRNCAA